MGAVLPPTTSEFETEEQAARYDRWFRAKVEASRNDPRPSIPHDEAMARIREKLAAKLAEQEAATGKLRRRDE
ncbi:Uncharacterised protein [Bordetella ansorpii]|uniref:Stability determinant domain-containing protein n=1 Tax=Bordetella ansorpii TaxID=288768 RepID=A0A146AUR5_9BORD|nr:hypothetical protein [Bordetella ansorpii]CZZ93343.1 Uncharacterised protein [Bordetella ansorpii]